MSFQPASVRTMLDMRHSLPVSTAYTTGAAGLPPVLRVSSKVPEGGYDVTSRGGSAMGCSRGSSSSLPCVSAVSPEYPRPVTAPAFVAASLIVDSVARDQQLDVDVVDEDALEAENDVDTLARASAVVYQLQNTWVEERQQARDELWQQLEQEYGVTPSRELLDSLDGNGGCRDMAGEAPTSAHALEVASTGALEAEAAAESAAAEAAADQITKEAAQQLEAVKKLRSRLEAARESECALVAARMDPLPAARPATAPATAPSPTAAALRRDIELLRHRQESLHSDTSAVDRGSAVTGISQLLPEEPELKEGLAEWFEEVRILDSIRGQLTSASSPKTFSTGLSPRSLPRPKATSTPATPKGSGTPRSKRELARIAEERAMDWDAARRGAGAAVGATATQHGDSRSGDGESPTRLGTSSTGKPPVKPGGLTKSGFTCLQPLLSSDGASNLGPAGLMLNAHLGTLSGTRCDVVGTPAPGGAMLAGPSAAGAAELQLDAILSECDEIDRIHESIQKKLSCG